MVAAVIGAVVWAASGVPVLAVTLHEQLHHAELHHHRADLHTALHGHAHDGMPDHDHTITAPPSAQRPSLPGGALAAALAACPSPAVDPDMGLAADTLTRGGRRHGPPPYLMHAALLI